MFVFSTLQTVALNWDVDTKPLITPAMHSYHTLLCFLPIVHYLPGVWYFGGSQREIPD